MTITHDFKPTESVAVENVSPARAKDFLELNNAKRKNRRLDLGRVETLAADMVAGRWLFNGAPIVISSQGNLDDGQHRCHAIILSGTTQKFVVIRATDPAAVFTIDQGKPRSTGDILTIRGTSPAQRNIVIGAATLLMNTDRDLYRSIRSRLRVADYVTEHQEELEKWAQWAHKVAALAPLSEVRDGRMKPRAISPSPLAALAIIMTRAGVPEEHVDRFFIGIANGETARSVNEAASFVAIRKRLVKVAPLTRIGGSGLPLLMEQFAILINCYNRWVVGDEIKLAKLAPRRGVDGPQFRFVTDLPPLRLF